MLDKDVKNACYTSKQQLSFQPGLTICVLSGMSHNVFAVLRILKSITQSSFSEIITVC